MKHMEGLHDSLFYSCWQSHDTLYYTSKALPLWMLSSDSYKGNIKHSGAKALCFFTVYSHLRRTLSFAPRDFTKPCCNAVVRLVDALDTTRPRLTPNGFIDTASSPAWQFLEDKRETPKRDNLTYTLTGKRELRRLSSAWDMFMCLCRRPGRKITQPEIYTGKMRLVQRSQAYGYPWKIALLGAILSFVHLLCWLDVCVNRGFM